MIARLFLATVFLFVFTPANAKTACVIRGIGGFLVAPMTKISDGMRAKGWKVKISEYYQGSPQGCDVVIAHSAGDIPSLNSGAKKVITIDPTFLNPGCENPEACKNYYAPIDALPFLICCGGYAVNGASNKQVPGTLSFFFIAPGHVSMPDRVANDVIAEAIR